MVDVSAQTLWMTTVHVRAGEFGALPNDFLNGIKEVSFGSNLAPCTYGKHASLHPNNKTMLGRTTIVYVPQSPPTAIRHQ